MMCQVASSVLDQGQGRGLDSQRVFALVSKNSIFPALTPLFCDSTRSPQNLESN